MLSVRAQLMGRVDGQSSDSGEFENGKFSNDRESSEGDEEGADTDSEEDDILQKRHHSLRAVLTQQTSLG